MVTKFYLKDAATTDTGTLPGASSQSTTSPNVTATGASTNRSMDGTITGSGNVDATLNSSATKSTQANWFRRYCSAPIATQSFDSSWLIGGGVAQATANTGNSAWILSGSLYIWRPSSGSLIGRLFDIPTNALVGTGATSTTETWTSTAASSGTALSSVSAVDGDILVFELWGTVVQAMATSYQWDSWYDGSTEGSSASPASYLEFNKDVVMGTTVRTPRNPGVNFQNPGVL